MRETDHGIATKRRPRRAAGGVLATLAVFTAVTFVAAGLLGAVQESSRIPAEVLELTQFGPALGVVVVALLWPARVRAVLSGAVRFTGRTDGPSPALLATAPLIIVSWVTAYGLVEGGVRFTDPLGLSSPFALIVVAQVIGACAEEIGWRCLMQPLLRDRIGPLMASIVVGLVWGAWHVQVFAEAPLYAASFLLAAVSMSVVLGLALERVRTNRLLAAGGFHALINFGTLLFMDEESGAVLPMALFGVSCLLGAFLWVWRAPARIHL